MTRRTSWMAWWQQITGSQAARPRARGRYRSSSEIAAEISLLEKRELLVAPAITNAAANQPAFDIAPIQPFSSLNIVDADNEAMFAKVTVTNGVNRGDFISCTAPGWLRTVNGFDIVYTRSFGATENIGNVVQAAVRSLSFQPRVNAIPGGMTEVTGFTVFVYDQVATASNSGTTVLVTSINDPPVMGGATANQPVNDNGMTVNPFASMTVTDADTQAANINVTIDNGVNRGDFTVASRAGWTRTVNGFDIVYSRVFGITENVGDTVQAAVRGMVFQARTNAIRVGVTETTQFDIRVSDGLASRTSTATTVVTTSVNDFPQIQTSVTPQQVNSNATINPFTPMTVTDPDFQDHFVRVIIENAAIRGDFTAGSTVGWTRITAGNEIRYERYFAPAANSGNGVQTALRALVFQPRTGAIPVGQEETTRFFVSDFDGINNITDSNTFVETTSV